MPKPIIFYVDPKWRHETSIHTPMLYPSWGNPPVNDRVLLRGMLAKQHNFDTSFYSITDKPEDADMVLMPYSHRVVRRAYPEILEECLIASKKYDIALLIEGIEDVEHKIDTPNTYVIRYGGYRFERGQNEIVIPPLANDLLEMYQDGQLQLRHKTTDKPVVGFAGWGSLTLYQTLRTVTKELPDRLRGILDSRFRAKKKGTFFRKSAMSVLTSSPLVTSNFIVRTGYSGHIDTATDSIKNLQEEFVNNLLQSDYGLDVRGDANASTRLYEMLSLGRIPLIIDTERNFPFSDEVEYSKFSLIVDFRDIKKLPKIISEFHESLTDDEFVAMQKAARDAFVRHFRIDALMPHIIKELTTKGALRQ
jgi:hypothetical protein